MAATASSPQYSGRVGRGGFVDHGRELPTSSLVLSMSVPRLLCREQYTATFRLKAYSAGFRTVRDLISIPADELFDKVPTSVRNQERIRRVLRAFGLELK